MNHVKILSMTFFHSEKHAQTTHLSGKNRHKLRILGMRKCDPAIRIKTQRRKDNDLQRIMANGSRDILHL